MQRSNRRFYSWALTENKYLMSSIPEEMGRCSNVEHEHRTWRYFASSPFY